MNSSNPVFSRWNATRGTAPADIGMHHPVGSAADARPGSHPLTNPYAPAQDAGPGLDVRAGRATMTLDDVVVRTATTLGTVALAAVLSWLLLPVDEADIGRSYGIAVGAALVAFVLSMIQAFKRTPSPALILGYSAFEGVFLGVLSSATSTYIAPGVVVQAVLGTFAVAAGMLVAYRLRWIRVTRRFAGVVGAGATGFLLLLVADSLFSAFGAGHGLGFHSGGLGIVFGLVGVVLGACFLALNFKQVEDAVAFGAPREEAWLAAFGLTMTLVWIYLEVLQVLTILNSDA
ncbi:Bax inhibitor-1/YccA family protein [Streptomyces sp. NPDC050400]|uniref:Bax inhibitor-1/YccA family protein n=1 Tax=Streptomyces sp. NPDC050400 TaxID=3365610 RepID=UPI003797F616